ncbi:MAG: 50S ribosomal protein L32 [Candidatus Falkowbacteria bacterium]|jgi:large subunit ribosomal protein L32
MPVPAKKRPRSEARRGRSHQALKPTKLTLCSKCGKAVLPHSACAFCGNYKGKQVITPKEVKAKK